MLMYVDALTFLEIFADTCHFAQIFAPKEYVVWPNISRRMCTPEENVNGLTQRDSVILHSYPAYYNIRLYH